MLPSLLIDNEFPDLSAAASPCIADPINLACEGPPDRLVHTEPLYV